MGAAQKPQPLIPGRTYQDEAFRVALRRLFMSWSRQKGKSYELGRQSFNRMMKRPGGLVTYISASVTLGQELLVKEAQIWQTMLKKMRVAAAAGGRKLTSTVDDLDFDALCDMFQKSKLETQLWHDQNTCSRTRVIAPNPDTAVGWTSDIFGDEVSRMPEAQALLEAIGPFMDSNPDLIMRMASTPAPDDKHYTFEMFQPPAELVFPLNPRGNFYMSASGIMVHRVDAWDAHAAGAPLYHPDTGKPITPEEHRATAFDKTGWDRNYALKYLPGGTAAVSAGALARAMARGHELGLLGVNVTEEVTA
jgi:hypothetical protein